MNWRQSGLFFREFFVEVARIGAAVLERDMVNDEFKSGWHVLTIVGKYGGGMRLYPLISCRKATYSCASALSMFSARAHAATVLG